VSVDGICRCLADGAQKTSFPRQAFTENEGYFDVTAYTRELAKLAVVNARGIKTEEKQKTVLPEV